MTGLFGWMTEGSIRRGGKKRFPPNRPDRQWGPLGHLFDFYLGFFPGGKASGT